MTDRAGIGVNASYRLGNVSLVSAVGIEAPEVVTSDAIDDLLASTYARLGLEAGRLEALAGVRERRWWPADMDYVDGAVEAGRGALAAAGVDPADVGLLINASVTRPHLEPAVAARVHHELGLPPGCLNFDITNACLGVVNSLHVAGAIIDAGQAEYALVVASEGVRGPQEETIARLLRADATRDDVKDAFATLTLGCGAVGLVLGRADVAGGHRIVGGVSRAGTAHHALCIGSMDGMRTDSHRLFVEGLALAVETWKDARGSFDWDGIDWFVAHQTSIAHIEAISEALSLEKSRFPLTLPTFGNIGPVALPFTLAHHADRFASGDRLLLMGIGSGLNTAYTEVIW